MPPPVPGPTPLPFPVPMPEPTPPRCASNAPVATGIPSTPASGRTRNYIVQRGETLTTVAQKFQCDMQVLAGVNNLDGPRYSIRPGQRLRLEGCRG